MATLKGHVNGHAHSNLSAGAPGQIRFSDVPSAIDIPVSGGENVEEAVEVDLEELPDDPTELCTLLENENAAKNIWLVISSAYAKQHRIDHAIEILNRGLQSLSRGSAKEKTGLLCLQCWLYLWKGRAAPRVAPEGELVSEARTKDFYLQAATGALNEASRVNPAFPPLVMARGVLSLLRASLQPPSKQLAPGEIEQSERVETLRQALKCFEDASRVSGGRSMMAVLGRARALFSLGRSADALVCYQEVLSKMPELQEPDPRIGIGCCLWQLNHVDEAKEAWDRALEINPQSKIARILLALSCLRDSSKFEPTDSNFALPYKKAMAEYAQQAFRLEKDSALTCATLGGYFLPRQAWNTVETLAKKAIELTDVNAIASDGWYLLARKEHYQEDTANLARVIDLYNRADNARGGGDRGFLPAKFGAAQAQILNKDIDGAKFRLEKIVQYHNNLEAKVVLGTLYAQDVFSNQLVGGKDDKSTELKKAISYLDTIRTAFKDPKKSILPDSGVLITLARLYEMDQPEKSLQCLLEVEQMQLDAAPTDFQYLDEPDDKARRTKMQAHLAPELLNNIACLYFQLERFEEASETYQAALSACLKLSEGESNVKSDELVTTISYNLARSYEGNGLLDEARTVYAGLIVRHPDYTDARTRLAYIELRQNPAEEGPKAVGALYESESADLEVRSLYGWYLSKAKKRVTNLAEDQEQRHYKHTLQHYDKHDQYSLTGMGNLYLVLAREMRRDTEQEKEKRRRTYEKAAEFYHKALQLDPKNAYAAQGIAIALAEDKKDFSGAVQIFSKVKDTVKDSNALINLGHVYSELKQFSRAIENYEAALAKDRSHDPQVLACLGRVWLLKGKQEKSTSAMKTSLEYSVRALEIAPEQIHFKFNVAFVHIQLAQLIYGLPETQRLLVDLEAAAQGLDEAIESFSEIAKAKNPPYPRHDIEQRANMGRNTMRKQLDRAVQQQREYEEANASKLAAAREARETEMRAREEVRRRAEEEEEERRSKLQEERNKMLEISRRLAEERAGEERRKEEAEWTENSEGERVKRKRRPKGAAGKRKKKEGTEDEDASDADSAGGAARRRRSRMKSEEGSGPGSGSERRAPRKKRKLARKGEGRGKSSKFKSSEFVDSDSDADMETAGNRDAFSLDEPETAMAATAATAAALDSGKDVEMADALDALDDGDDSDAVQAPRKATARLIDDDSDSGAEPTINGNKMEAAARQALALNGDDDDDDDDDGGGY